MNAQLLGDASPFSGRYDVKSDLANGFPYSLGHASVVGGMLAILVAGHPPKKRFNYGSGRHVVGRDIR